MIISHSFSSIAFTNGSQHARTHCRKTTGSLQESSLRSTEPLALRRQRTSLDVLAALIHCARLCSLFCTDPSQPLLYSRSVSFRESSCSLHRVVSYLQEMQSFPERLVPPQGPTGCAKITWRLEPGGYLKQINARVYDIAVSLTSYLDFDTITRSTCKTLPSEHPTRHLPNECNCALTMPCS